MDADGAPAGGGPPSPVGANPATNPLLEAALEWAGLGAAVVPCRGKHPGAFLGEDWGRKASRDHAQLREWWGEWPDANVGVVPGDTLLLLDVDDPEALERLEETLGPAPPTPRYFTNGSPDVTRERLVFRHPGGEVRKSALGDGLELRAGALMSIVPPSINPKTGEPYEWRDGLDETSIYPLPPGWLVQPQNGAAGAPDIPDVIPLGARHDTLVSFAGSMRRRGARAPEITAALWALNERCAEPLARDEVERIASSMERYPPAAKTASAASPPKESVVVTERLRDLNAALRETPARAEWVWGGYVPRCGVAALAGRPKVGKSYLLFGLLAALRKGEAFLGAATTATRAVLLTEERHTTLREKRDHFELGNGVDVLMRHEATGIPWPELVAEVSSYCRAHEIGLLIVDTWDKWTGLGGEQENVAGAVNEAMAPLLDVAVERAVLVSTHQRKAGGKHGEAVRGSNALAGAVDVLVELERLKGADEDARVLYAVSRYVETPAEMGLRFTEDGYERGETSEIRTADSRRRVQAALEQLGTGTAKEVGIEADVSESSARRRLRELETDTEEVVSDSSKSPTTWRHHHKSLGGDVT